jgi:esterase/lipase
MKDFDALILIVVGVTVNVPQYSGHTTTERVVQEHLLDSTVEQWIGGIGLDSCSQLIDQLTSTLDIWLGRNQER